MENPFVFVEGLLFLAVALIKLLQTCVFSRLCPCCSIALKEPVSHEVPGVLLFKCGEPSSYFNLR